MAIIWGHISVVNIILRDNSLSASCPRANYLGDNFRARNSFREAVILGSNCPGGNYPGEQMSGGQLSVGQLSGDNYPGAIIQGATVLFPFSI